MDSPVVKHASASGRIGPPAKAYAPLSIDAGKDFGHSPDFSRVYHLFYHAIVNVPPPVLMRRKKAAVLLRRQENLLQLLAVHSHRLFAHDMLSGVEARDGKLRVHVVGRANQHEIHAGIGQERLEPLVRYQPGFLCLRQLLRLNVVGGHHLQAVHAPRLVQMIMPHISKTDNARPDLHCRFPPLLVG